MFWTRPLFGHSQAGCSRPEADGDIKQAPSIFPRLLGRLQGAWGSAPAQPFVVLRHAERLDRADPDAFRQSPDSECWPHDTPITIKGRKQASDAAKDLLAIHKETPFAVIVTSPYLRCLQTAAAVVKVLKLPVLVDQELGEIRDSNMPEHEAAHRTGEGLWQLCASLGMTVANSQDAGGQHQLVGALPSWPERLDVAKERFARRLEMYLEHACSAQQAVLLVTHADAVVTATELFSRSLTTVEEADYCAYVVAKRQQGQATKDAHGAFVDHWKMSTRNMKVQQQQPGPVAPYIERLHVDRAVEIRKTCEKADVGDVTECLNSLSAERLTRRKDPEQRRD